VVLLIGGAWAGTAHAAHGRPATEGRILSVQSQFGRRPSGTTVRVSAFQTPSGERLVNVSGSLRWCDEKNDDLVLRRFTSDEGLDADVHIGANLERANVRLDAPAVVRTQRFDGCNATSDDTPDLG
jgi:hypothetical protein